VRPKPAPASQRRTFTQHRTEGAEMAAKRGNRSKRKISNRSKTKRASAASKRRLSVKRKRRAKRSPR